MPLEIGWRDIALRLLCTVIAGAVIGINREEHGRTAGLRTTILVCMGASLSMILANLMLTMTGKNPGSFIQLDVMRLPLGILSGMGFIGAGAILQRDNLVLGVTTAAALWFATVMGLCFGGGEFGLGFAAMGIGFVTLTGLKWIEKRIKLERHATLAITVGADKVVENDIIRPFMAEHYKVTFSAITYAESGEIDQLHAEVRWRGKASDGRPPAFLKQLVGQYRFQKMEWRIMGEP
ncbi:MAG TPA: MgtC/SapB family protein [Desulfuromonadaceae bacterium]|nr:MgtC/SapB family protein [Desulfuromonadaceae bacterium]